MNEPPGARARVALTGLTLLNISVMEMDKVKERRIILRR
jgi:F0F1-type ATP synthase beta subunit